MPQITARLSPKIRDRFDRYAAKVGLDASELARLLILREMRVRRLLPVTKSRPSRRVAPKTGGERKLTAHFHLADNVDEFARYASAEGFNRAAAARLIAEQELREKWLAKALVWIPSVARSRANLHACTRRARRR
jgi:antitoxin component of RelBE/YafQ-DinJ toxin-antitoxin module